MTTEAMTIMMKTTKEENCMMLGTATGVHTMTPPNHVPRPAALATRLRIATTVGYGTVIYIWGIATLAGEEYSARCVEHRSTTHAFLDALFHKTSLRKLTPRRQGVSLMRKVKTDPFSR